MSLLVWNCCGLKNPRTVKELGDYIRAKDPTVVFLTETWADSARLDQVLRNFDFRNKWSVESGNRGGGLILLWKEGIKITVEDSLKYCIDVLVEKNTPREWRFTGFYRESVTARRHEAWSKLRTLNDKPHIPWLCAGDFNEITRQEEKVGGAVRAHGQMQAFKDVIDECKFMDLGYIGPNFTWSKHYTNGHSIWERLDRGLATN